MWGPLCSCPVPVAAICYRRCVPCGSPRCSYACATLPPSSIPVDPISCKARSKKKKKKKGKKTSKTLGQMTSSQVALMTKSDLGLMTPSKLALLSQSKQELVLKKMKDAGIALDKFEEAGMALRTSKSGYAGSEGGYVTRRCDPRCRARRNRPATAGCTPRQQVTDFCPAKYKTEASVYCGIGGVNRSDATTATDIKTNASTSTNNLDFIHCAQKAARNAMLDNMYANPQCAQAMYNQALQQQWLQKCYYCQVMAQQNPFGFGAPQVPRVPQVPAQQKVLQVHLQPPQNAAQSQNSFQHSLFPSSSLFSGSISFPSNQSQNMHCYNTAQSWSGVNAPRLSAYVSTNVAPTGKRCETCGRISPRK